MDLKRIQVLSTDLANQIAAGEVIERPASVLKELLENSLDAKSTQIDITIERAGIGAIRVQDDGIGICKEDLVLAICPHATSKIEGFSDLEAIASYGFRGEALASISAISRLKISSWIIGQTTGWSIALQGRGTQPECTPAPKRTGTFVEIRDLFYNTPARRKFLRADKTELMYVEEVFKRIALSQPKVAFKFQIEKRTQKRFPKCLDLEAHTKRVALLCGKSFAEEAAYLEAEANGLRLKGWLGPEKSMRAQADLQFFYVNNRIVRDKVIMHAVRQAYQTLVLSGKHPAYVLYLDIEPVRVDVNVHPTKHEVRFREARVVHDFLVYAIKEALEQGNEGSKIPMELSVVEERVSDPLFSHSAAPVFSGASTTCAKPIAVLEEDILLAEKDNQLIVVDIKVARFALTLEQLKAEYHAGGVERRMLLMPKSIMLGRACRELEAKVANWQRFGFDFTQIGEETILVRAVPKVFGSRFDNIKMLLTSVMETTEPQDVMEVIAKQAVAQAFSKEENETLLLELEKTIAGQGENLLEKHYQKITAKQLRKLVFGETRSKNYDYC